MNLTFESSTKGRAKNTVGHRLAHQETCTNTFEIVCFLPWAGSGVLFAPFQKRVWSRAGKKWDKKFLYVLKSLLTYKLMLKRPLLNGNWHECNARKLLFSLACSATMGIRPCYNTALSETKREMTELRAVSKKPHGKISAEPLLSSSFSSWESRARAALQIQMYVANTFTVHWCKFLMCFECIVGGTGNITRPWPTHSKAKSWEPFLLKASHPKCILGWKIKTCGSTYLLQ